jgi:hypothetical protein
MGSEGIRQPGAPIRVEVDPAFERSADRVTADASGMWIHLGEV